MKQDERNLPLSTDSAEAARLFDRAVEHYLKYHIDTMSLVGSALAADPDFVMVHCLKGYLLLSRSKPGQQPADRRHSRRRTGQRQCNHTTREAACRRLRRLVGWRTRQILRHLAADPRYHANGSARVAHLRHHVVPPRPDTEDPRTGRPHRATLVTGPARVRHAAMRLGLRTRRDRRLCRRRTCGRCRAGT